MDVQNTKSDCVQELFNRTTLCTLPTIGDGGKGIGAWKVRLRTKLSS